MSRALFLVASVIGLMCAATISASARPVPLSTAFTYQGRLKLGGVPLNNTADFQFTLWDAASGPTQVAGPVAVNSVTIASGLFAAPLDFGSDVFNGDARWLQIAVRSPAGFGPFTTLSPRQSLMAEPYSLQTRGIFVDHSNNVGLGTTAPNEKLTVAGSMEVGTGSGDYQHLRVGGGNSSGFLWGDYGAYGDGIHLGYNFYSSPGYFHIPNPGGGTSKLTVGYGMISMSTAGPGAIPVQYFTMDFLGRIGLGTTTPTHLLQLQTNDAAKPTSNTWTIASDRRLKKNIQPIKNALERLMQLRGVTYQWIHPETQGDMTGTYTGMIAQEVEKVFPEWISTGPPPERYKSLTVIGFEGLVVEALRDLRSEKQAQLVQQSQRIDSLESENAALRERLDALEKTIRTRAQKEQEQ